MFAYWYNYAQAEYNGLTGPSPKLRAFMQSQLDWTRSQVAGLNKSDPFWAQVGLLLAQFDGLRDGYFAVAPTNETGAGIDELVLYMLNSVGDLEDLNGRFPRSDARTGRPLRGATWMHREAMHAQRRAVRSGHAHSAASLRKGFDPIPEGDKLTDCSALIRLVPATNVPGAASDIYAGHTTWRSFYAMLRIYKVYAFPASVYPAGTVSIASSPGLLHSKDDFYAMERFVVMETTNSVMNGSLWSALTPHSLLSWQRVTVANGLASSGKGWTDLFNRYSSGTYSNQWMVLDLSLFAPGAPLPQQDLLWITESVPGVYMESADVTSVLVQQGYWASYNIPYFPFIFNISGYPAYEEKYGPQYNYNNASRALIFARNVSEGYADTLEGFQALMRYNNWANDPLSRGDSVLGSVSSRADFLAKPVPFGGVDSKVVAASMITPSPTGPGSNVLPTINVLAQCGPTYDQQPVFQWSQHPEWSKVSHIICPDRFDFPYVNIGVQPTPTPAPARLQ
jgi:hypothetical protein